MLKLLKEDAIDPKLFVDGLSSLMQEVVDSVSYYIEEIGGDEDNEIKLFELFIFMTDLYSKVRNVRDISGYKNIEELLYINVNSVVQSGNKGLIWMFRRLWEVLIRNKVELNMISRFDALIPYFSYTMEKEYDKCFQEYNNIVITILNNMKSDDLLGFLSNVLSIYPQVSYILRTYFDGYKILNKEKLFLQNLFDTNKTLSVNEQSIEKLLNKIYTNDNIVNNYDIINMMKILLVSPKHFDCLTNALLKAVKLVLKKFTNSPAKVFRTLSSLSKYFLSDRFIMAYIKDEKESHLKQELKQILNDILVSLDKAKSFSISFNTAIIEQDTALTNLIYDYLDILDDISAFEEYYTRDLLDRALLDSFNLQLEKDIIDNIIHILKDKFIHSYKLQTTINSIKRSNNGVMNIVGIPSHCYQVLNLGCVPMLQKSVQAVFDANKLGLPTNSRLIFQQGYIEVIFNRKYELLLNPLQYSLLILINEKKVINVVTLLEELEMTESLIMFLLSIPIKEGLVLLNENQLKINKDFKKDEYTMPIDLRGNLYSYVEIAKENGNKISERHYSNVIDCYVIKYLKKVKQADIKLIKTEIMNIKYINTSGVLNEKLIEDRIGYLTTKELIKHIGNEIYSYN
jgi:hypothetical protein